MCSAAILEWVNVFLLSSSSSNINKRNIDSNTYEEHELTVSTLLFVLESHQLISPSTYDTKGKEKDVKYLRSQLETIFETSFAEEEYITIQFVKVVFGLELGSGYTNIFSNKNPRFTHS